MLVASLISSSTRTRGWLQDIRDRVAIARPDLTYKESLYWAIFKGGARGGGRAQLNPLVGEIRLFLLTPPSSDPALNRSPATKNYKRWKSLFTVKTEADVETAIRLITDFA